jgi:hypothetical protein
MNKSYRLIYNEITNSWVAVAETVKGRGKRASRAVVLAVAAVLMPLVQSADALRVASILSAPNTCTNPALRCCLVRSW